MVALEPAVKNNEEGEQMVECKKCEGLGTIECPDCSDGNYQFFMSGQCSTCNSNLFLPCPDCEGKGKVPKEKK